VSGAPKRSSAARIDTIERWFGRLGRLELDREVAVIRLQQDPSADPRLMARAQADLDDVRRARDVMGPTPTPSLPDDAFLDELVRRLAKLLTERR
jgi:hypothetical protein